MARLGKSPTRWDWDQRQPRAITLAMITHIPHLIGYHKDKMRIAELCLNSMITNSRSTHQERFVFDLVVFDQGSCPEWKGRLRQLNDSGYIHTLIESSNNIGKCHALHQLVKMGDSKYFMYTDDDVLFYEDWLSKQMDLLKATDTQVKLVTGWPVISRFHHYTKMHDEMREEGLEVFEDRISDRWIELDAMGRGLPMDAYLAAPEANRTMYRVRIGEQEPWAVGHHMQFLAEREALQDALPRCKMRLMGQMRDMDENLLANGWWSLATDEPTCRHMGNVMDNTIVDDVLDMELVL